MEPGKRRKPLRNNVRTGCITCKQRRVKCPEQRPHCSRCIKAGFDCAGYAIPVARIFKSSAETTNDSDEARSKSSEQSPSTTSSTSESPERWSSKRPLPLVSIRSPVQLGNSDPFNALPIRLGPCETRLLRIYPALLMPRSDRSGSRQVVRLPAVAVWTHYGIGLEDEAAAYSLLARSAALENWNLNGWNAAPSIPLIKYVTMSQAALHRKLPLLGGFQTPEIVYSVMWTSAILAMADMFMGSLNVHIYSRAMCKMMVLYVELAGRDFQPEMILYPLGVDGIRSLSTMTRSNVDMIHWFPQVFRNMWDEAAILCPIARDDMSIFHVHTDVKDAVLRDIILSQQENRNPYLDAQNTRMNAADRLLIANTVRTQELFRYGRLLNIAFEETECLEELPSLAKQPSQLMEDQIARLYMTFATLLWMNLTSPTSFASNAMMDSTPFFLKQLKATIRKSNWHQNVRPDSDRPYATAKLWALFVGVHAELQHRDTHKADFVCADWFFKAFQMHADAMSIRSWQQSVILLRQILYSDRMRPHISEWWHRVFPVVKSESVDDKRSFFS